MKDNYDNGYFNENIMFEEIDDTVLKDKAKKRRKVLRERKARRRRKLRKTAAFVVVAAVIVIAVVITSAFGLRKRSSIKENNANNLAIAAGDESAGQDISGEYQSGDLNGDGSHAFDNNIHEDGSTVSDNNTHDNNAGSSASSETTSASQPVETPTKPSVNGIYTDIDTNDINSQYAVIYDCNKKTVLAGLNQNEKMYPASMTKILTLIVAVENIKDLSKTYALTQAQIDVLYKRGASRVGLERNKPVTAEDCLYGLILPSGADAAVALACMAAGSEEKFADMMNEKCRQLGLKNSHFTNATGLHDANQYTTVYEMCKIMECAMSNPTCAKVLNTASYTMKATTKDSPNGISVSNNALNKLKKSTSQDITVMGAKTGFTNEAMYCMSSCAVKSGIKYIIVTAKADKSSDYINDACKLYTDYCR